MNRKLALTGAMVIAAALWAAPAAAQATLGADLGLNSHYVWRGLTFTNKPVVQPDLYLSLHGFTAGAWLSIEPSQYNGPNDLSEGGGVGSGVREADFWAEYGRSTGNVSWKAGWIMYTFDMNDAGFTAFYDTHEFYGQASIGGLPFTPTLYASYDVDKVKGAYLQPSVSYGVKASPTLTINLGALAGISAGQEFSASDPSYNFAKSGLTHVDFSASTSIAAGALSIAPAFHVQISNDAATKVTGANAANQDKGTKFWGGITLSWSRALGTAK
jgi:hypothetical protein